MGNGRRWDERKGRDGPKWPAPARIRGGDGKNGAKRKQRRTKWPAPAKIRGDRVQGWEMGEGGTNERAKTALNGRPLPE